MANLEHRFDEYTEQFASKQLLEIRSFAETKPLPKDVVLEIGSNRGRFLGALATQNSDRYHIGIEIRLKYARLARRDHEKLGLTNIDIICGDANLALPIMFDDGQIKDVFILFPDPWWKKRHAKRRLVQPAFLDVLSRKMRVGGHVWIRTDVGPLADAMRSELINHPNFEPLAAEDYPKETFPRTTRERTVMREQMPVNLVYYRHIGPSE